MGGAFTRDRAFIRINMVYHNDTKFWDCKNLSWVRVADRKICPRVTVWHHKTLHQTTIIDSFSCIPFDFNVKVAINESCSYTLTSAILKVGVVCDVAMTSTPKVLMTGVTRPPIKPMY